MAKPTRYTFDIPNPKAGFAIRVVAERLYSDTDRAWSLIVQDPNGHTVGESKVMTGPFTRWVQMHNPEVSHTHRQQGYGLALYLAGALLAKKLRKKGVEACASFLTEHSFRLWTLMWEHRLARCDTEPEEQDYYLTGDHEAPQFYAPCYLHAVDVEKAIKKWMVGTT